MSNSYKIILVLMLSAAAIPLAACQDAQPSALSTAATQAHSNRSTTLLPGEISGCGGDVCAGKPDYE